MSDNNGEFGAFLAGFVIGGLVGAATALILTPQSGEDTRATLSQRGAEWRDRGTQQWGDARERASSVLAETRGRRRLLSRFRSELFLVAIEKARQTGQMPARIPPPTPLLTAPTKENPRCRLVQRNPREAGTAKQAFSNQENRLFFFAKQTKQTMLAQ